MVDRRRFAPRPGDEHPVGAFLAQGDGVEAGRHVGVGVAGAADLVEELGGDGANGDRPAVPGVLGDDRRAVAGDLGDGEPGSLEAGDLGEEAVVAARGLRSALDDVAGDDRPGQGVPVGSAPPVPPGRGADGEGGVGDPAGDDDVGAGVEGGGDPPAPEVGVGGHDLALAERFAGLEVGEVDACGPQVLQAGDQVVALHVGDGRAESQPVGDGRHRVGARPGGQPAGVGHHLDAPLHAGPHDLLHLGDEGPGVAGPGVADAVLGQDQHGQLGQPVTGQHVDGAPVDHLRGGAQTVTVEAAAVGDAYRSGSTHERGRYPSLRRMPRSTASTR